MKKAYYIPVLFSVLLLACGGGKKQTLELEKKEEIGSVIEIPTTLAVDTVMPNPGIKYRETRRIDPSNPPIMLKLDEPQEKKVFDMADYYSSVKYIMLDFPHKEKFAGFLGDASVHVTFERGSMSIRSFSSDIILTGNSIVVGDNLLGYYQYDENGNFVKDIVKPIAFPHYNKSNNEVSFERNEDSEYISNKAQSYGDMLTFSEVKGKKAYTNYYSIGKQGIYYSSYMRFGSAIPISENEMIAYRYNPAMKEQVPIIYSFSIKGDTLCRFMNQNPLFDKEIKGAYTNPESADFFYYNGALNFRQPYNDTIYSFKSSHELNARYVLSYAKYKPSIETALLGNKAGKYFISNIKESEHFLYIVYTSNYDCPNNRKNGSVKFYYSLYDKKDRKFYQIAEDMFPENMVLKNSLQDGIPINLYHMNTIDNKLYMSYSKLQLKNIISDKSFANYPTEQQEKLTSLHDNLSDGGSLVVIFE